MITINRNEKTALAFAINDPANGLAAMRVTWSIAEVLDGARILRKVGGLPGSSADITITTQTAGSIVGVINLAVADFAGLLKLRYLSSLWIDDGISGDRCVTPGGTDNLVITSNVPRLA